MAMAVKASRVVGALMLLLAHQHAAAAAEPEGDRELGRWVPSVGFVLSISANNANGALFTSDVLGPSDMDGQGADAAQPLLPGTPASASSIMMTPTFGGSFELMTPGLRRVFAGPRAFARVEISYAFGPVYELPSVGDPGVFRTSNTVVPGGGFVEDQVLGQGGWTRAQVEPLVVMAGAGVALTLDAWGRALRIKPSFEYMREEIQVTGLVRRAVQQSSTHTSLDQFRDVTLAAEESRVYHFIGPGIELDFDAARAGPFLAAPYLGFRVWANLDNSSIVMTNSNEWNETALWFFKPDKWAYGGTIGLRFRWSPE